MQFDATLSTELWGENVTTPYPLHRLSSTPFEFASLNKATVVTTAREREAIAHARRFRQASAGSRTDFPMSYAGTFCKPLPNENTTKDAENWAVVDLVLNTACLREIYERYELSGAQVLCRILQRHYACNLCGSLQRYLSLMRVHNVHLSLEDKLYLAPGH